MDYQDLSTLDPFSAVYDSNATTDNEGDYFPPESGICEKSWVREFRGSYEPPFYWIIFAVGAIGNLLVVWIYTTVRNRLKTMTDVYLLNLAISDLLFLATLPFWATDAAQGWVFSVSVCKGVCAVYKINLFASMLLLTCISVDRYISIVHVTQAHNFKNKRMFYSKLACLFVWLLSCLLSIPEFLFAKITVGFCIPILVMLACYSVIIRSLIQARNFEKHKALRVILAVVGAFVLSQLPYNGHLIVEATQAYNMTMTVCDDIKTFDVAGQVVKSLAYTHCCLNPILYAFIGVRIQKDLLHLCHCLTSGLGGVNNVSVPKRPSVMSDTDTTPALSL